MKLSDEFKVGVFASISIVLLILGFNFLKGKDVFATSDMLYSQYAKIDGLSKANPVMFKGLQIGKVIEIEPGYDENDSLVITVGFTIDPEVKIPAGSIAKIAKPDPLSAAAIIVTPPRYKKGQAPKQATYVTDGEFLTGIVDPSITDQLTAVVSPLKNKTEQLMKELSITIEKLDEALDEEGQAQIKSSLTNFQTSTKHLSTILAASARDIDIILNDFKGASSSIKSSTGKLDKTIDNVNSLADSLRKAPIVGTVAEAKMALERLNNILASTEGTESTMGLLLNDPSLYENLDEAIKSIDILVKDIKAHPRNYLKPLGKKDN